MHEASISLPTIQPPTLHAIPLGGSSWSLRSALIASLSFSHAAHTVCRLHNQCRANACQPDLYTYIYILPAPLQLLLCLSLSLSVHNSARATIFVENNLQQKKKRQGKERRNWNRKKEKKEKKKLFAVCICHARSNNCCSNNWRVATIRQSCT